MAGCSTLALIDLLSSSVRCHASLPSHSCAPLKLKDYTSTNQCHQVFCLNSYATISGIGLNQHKCLADRLFTCFGLLVKTLLIVIFRLISF